MDSSASQLTPGDGCTQLGVLTYMIECSTTGVTPTSLDIELGDGNDHFMVSDPTSMPMRVIGGAGDDTIMGSLGADYIDGGPGDDHLTLTDGAADELVGGDGSDWLAYW